MFDSNDFLAKHQKDTLKRMSNGCILNGGVGSGKSRTGLYYYFSKYGGSITNGVYTPMNSYVDLYIITTAKKRNDQDWSKELAPFLLSTKEENFESQHVKIYVDSWNNIKKYTNVKDSFFIFDEQRVVGWGAWSKSFVQIAKNNKWILLSATPGDKWEDYIPVFIANGFYRNKTEFSREHLVYSRFTKYPRVEKYISTGRLIRQRNMILVDMDFERKTKANHIDIFVDYDINKYKTTIKNRWNPYTDEPIEQASGLCYALRRIVNENDNRFIKLYEILESTPRAIIFYNFDYELEMLRQIELPGYKKAEWNGHKHQNIPNSNKWLYFVQYNAGSEGWNCIKTDTIIFFSQNYSYKMMHQASGRIDRLNTPFTELYYYHLKTRSSIDIAIARALKQKKNFNENRWASW